MPAKNHSTVLVKWFFQFHSYLLVPVLWQCLRLKEGIIQSSGGLTTVKIFENRCIYFRFVFGQMVREAKSKFRSVKLKKRKGFHGRRSAQLQKERDDRNARMIPLVLQVLDDKAPLSSSSPCKENVFVKKLHNSSFEKIEREKGILTREKAKHIGAASSTFNVQLISSYRIPPCEQSLSKTHQRASKRGSA